MKQLEIISTLNDLRKYFVGDIYILKQCFSNETQTLDAINKLHILQLAKIQTLMKFL